MTITISAGKQEQVLGIAMSPTKHQGSESTTKEIPLPLKPYTVASQASPDAADDRSADVLATTNAASAASNHDVIVSSSNLCRDVVVIESNSGRYYYDYKQQQQQGGEE